MGSALKNVAAMIVSALLSYAVAEAGYSYCYRYGLLDNVRDGWFFEEAGQTIHFDPVIGYTLTQHPSRNVRISEGQIEYEGVFKGNNQGFQDADDFSPGRPPGNPFRVAVLGDSFSSGQFLAVNWPDRVEQLAAERLRPTERPLQLLNFSLYSGGLVNWRNILLERIEKEAYQLDLLVIPVYANDLFRPFMLFEARNTRKLLIGRAGLDPDALPRDLDQARQYLSDSDGYILTAAEWRQMLDEGWHPDLPRPMDFYMAKHLYFLAMVGWHQLQEMATPATGEQIPVGGEGYAQDPGLQRGQFTVEHKRLIEDVRQSLSRQRLQVLVVRVPGRDELVHDAAVAGNVTEFAEMLGAPVVDGAQAFSELDKTARHAQYFPYDGHWNQQGSDRFASFLLRQLEMRSGGQSSALPVQP